MLENSGKYIPLLPGGRLQEDPSGPAGPGERALYRVRGDDWNPGAAQLRHQAGLREAVKKKDLHLWQGH